jgi:hypothetical protein
MLEGEEMAKPYNLLSYNSQGEPAVEQLAANAKEVSK